jgi:hypothetical protein
MDKEEVANPLVQNGLKLIPNVTRVFNKKKTDNVCLLSGL